MPWAHTEFVHGLEAGLPTHSTLPDSVWHLSLTVYTITSKATAPAAEVQTRILKLKN